jgi:hypothetical protein
MKAVPDPFPVPNKLICRWQFFYNQMYSFRLQQAMRYETQFRISMTVSFKVSYALMDVETYK